MESCRGLFQVNNIVLGGERVNIKNSKFFAESWNVAIRKKGKGDILTDLRTPFKILKNSFFSWSADPFIFEFKGITYIFAEIYDYRLRRGTLGYSILKGDRIGRWKQIIIENYHLSYPFIFEYAGDVYIIPESNENNSLNVYRALNFPDEWEKVTVLIHNKKFVDTTFFEWENCICAFTTDVSEYDNQREYFITFNERKIASIDEIMVSDTKTSRMGGNVLQIEDRMIKVCQDCRKTYGGGLIFKEIEEDNLDGKEVRQIFPETLRFDKRVLIDGIHTYNANERYEIIDIKTRRFNILDFIFRLLENVKRK